MGADHRRRLSRIQDLNVYHAAGDCRGPAWPRPRVGGGLGDSTKAKGPSRDTYWASLGRVNQKVRYSKSSRALSEVGSRWRKPKRLPLRIVPVGAQIVAYGRLDAAVAHDLLKDLRVHS